MKEQTVLPVTKVEDHIGKESSMEVSESTLLHIKVLTDSQVEYHFDSEEDGHRLLSPKTRAQLEVSLDELEDYTDYSFTDAVGGRFFLFQFFGRPSN